MTSALTPEQRHWWRIALELKLRKCGGDAFQDFFSTVMAMAHGSDFVRVRAFGALGDKGCDGYLASSGKVFQCYGALNGSTNAKTLVAKMNADFATALTGVSAIMKQWHMVHNMVEGLPISAVTALDALKNANPTLAFGFMGFDGFEHLIFGLAHSKIEDLLGVVATAADSQNLQSGELKSVVDEVSAMADSLPVPQPDPKPVPVDKLEFNNLPNSWRFLISGGWQNARYVGEYFDRHVDTMLGERIAQFLRTRYLYLRAQGLPPGEIMSALYDLVTGSKTGSISAQRQVAAQALLAFFFESCDILT